MFDKYFQRVYYILAKNNRATAHKEQKNDENTEKPKNNEREDEPIRPLQPFDCIDRGR